MASQQWMKSGPSNGGRRDAARGGARRGMGRRAVGCVEKPSDWIKNDGPSSPALPCPAHPRTHIYVLRVRLDVRTSISLNKRHAVHVAGSKQLVLIQTSQRAFSFFFVFLGGGSVSNLFCLEPKYHTTGLSILFG